MNRAEHQLFFCFSAPGRLIRFGGFGLALVLCLTMAGCRYRLPPIEPVTLVPTLPVPYTKPVAGTVAYGATVRFAVDSLPTGVTLEYSADNGKRWQTGDSLLLQTGTTVQLRSRRGPYASAIGTASFAVGFKRVLIIGNSITRHAPDPDRGWLGSWGMAASAPAKDYANLLTERLRSLDSQVVVKLHDGVSFEQQFWTYNYAETRSLAAFKPDLVIMRIGENVPDKSAVSQNFKRHYERLIDSVTVGNPRVKIVCSTSFFDQPVTSDLIRQVATTRRFNLAEFHGLVNNKSLQAYDRFKDSGVAMHPGDKGMLAIADIIWDKVH